MISVRKSSPFDSDASSLIDELDRYQAPLYPPESNYHDSREILAQPSCHFVAAYEDGLICGIGAVKLFEDYGEIKRVYVPERARGKGVAALVVGELEGFLIRSGLRIARLETGNKHFEALRFYRRQGYTDIGVFGDYWADPLSVFLEKRL